MDMDKASSGHNRLIGGDASDIRIAHAHRKSRRGLPRPSWREVLALGFFVVFLAAWAVASPVASSPDEDFHLASIWCAQGDRDLACKVSDDGAVYEIPPAVRHAPCFAFHPEIPGSCQVTTNVREDDVFVATDRGNFGAHAGEYPGEFYSMMSLFVGPDVARSVIVMRLVNVLIMASMVAVTYAASSLRARRALVATVGTTLIPLGAFIVPSINPSSWAVISAATLLFAVSGFMVARERGRMITLGTVAVIALGLGAGARADAAAYAIIAIGAATVTAMSTMASPWNRRTLGRLVLPVCLAVVAGVSYLTAGQASAAGQSAGRGPSEFLFVSLDTLSLWVGSFGLSPLGWFDTPLPSVVWVPVAAVFFAVIFVAMSAVGRWRGAMVAFVALSAFVLPTYIQASAVEPIGSVQPRYIYPLLIVLMAVATLSTEQREFVLSPVQRWIIVGVLSAANSVALYETLRRFVTGTSVRQLRLAPGDWWWSSVPFSSEMVWAAGSTGFFVALALASRVLVRRVSAEDPMAGVETETASRTESDRSSFACPA
ncbi:Predicted membrane protein [Sanguibacter gelidistatuariae]|uniref:Predicted membrane protein n=1 Tax=Sanguibacter gelidistatuariae TaxID=1814289 RepID=A0A1G6XZ22_9MICO|nr:DUF2142 domain-containing protein [Sanguibacter gelidistatuariae]SDD82707.1 Predicted membrane protein [Sanguibacter gelidistatuariae]